MQSPKPKSKTQKIQSKMRSFAGIISIILLTAFSVHADYLKVSRDAFIKNTPERASNNIVPIKTGTFIMLLDDGVQENGYYHVQSPKTNTIGWIYRTYVRRYLGEMPSEELSVVDTDPMRDNTLYLTNNQKLYAKKHLASGKPQAFYERVFEGFVVAVDARLKIPVWVQYELSIVDIDVTLARKDNFQPDYTIPFGARSELSDYDNSGFDQGHMAPAADMKRNEKVMNESFLLSNMCPQVGVDFNRGIWADLEDAVRKWVRQRGTLTIITGPVFKDENGSINYKVIGDNKVAVPTHFYKIIADTNDPSNTKAVAFLLPNMAIKNKKIKDFLCSINEIEKLTGFDFLSALPANIQESVESAKIDNLW